MTNRKQTLRMLGLGLLALAVQGCAARGSSPYAAWKPNAGWWSPRGAAGNTSAPTWTGPQVQPGTGLQPTPAMQPPAIQPGPALPDASGRKYRAFPAPATHARPQFRRPLPHRRALPPIVPNPASGAPIARQEEPSTQRPAELSGDIEIIPGPTLRARRARMDMLPTPPQEAPEARVEGTSQTRVEELNPPSRGRFEELPPPE